MGTGIEAWVGAEAPFSRPVSFLGLYGPGFRLEKTKITGAIRKIGEVPRRHERIVGFSFAHLFALELIANAVIFRGSVKRLPELLDRAAASSFR